MTEEVSQKPNAQNNTEGAGGGGSTTEVKVTGTATKPAEGAKAPDAGAAKPAEGAKAPDADKSNEGAPEKYDFKVPEGVVLEADVLSEFEKVAKEDLKLPQDKAQKLIDVAVKHANALAEKQRKMWDDTRKAWAEEIKTDAEYGGAKFGETIERAQRTITRFFGPKFSEFLDSTGYGDNAELIRGLAKIDRVTGEDKVVDGKPTAVADGRTPAEIIYGKPKGA